MLERYGIPDLRRSLEYASDAVMDLKQPPDPYANAKVGEALYRLLLCQARIIDRLAAQERGDF